MDYSVVSESGFGSLLRFRRNRLAFIAEAGSHSLDIRRMNFLGRRIFQINHPELVRDVLVTHDWNFVKGRGLLASRPVLGHGLLTSEGELHRRQRRLVQPAFHSARLKRYGQIMVECAQQASDEWQDFKQLAIDQEMMRLTLRIVGHTLFSADLKNDADGVSASLTSALRVFLTLNNPLTLLFTPVRRTAERKAKQAREQIEQVLRGVIDSHRRHEAGYDDMLSMMMHSSSDTGTGNMSDELLLDESLTLFLAGHETTANALTWAWYLLALHPSLAEQLHMELDDVLGGRPPALDDLDGLEFTGRVFREVLRLYPPAWVIVREVVTDYRLGNVHVPAGSTVLMSPYAMHRDPRFWERPEIFDPDRWKNDGSSDRPKFAFFPFGAGSRVCIGEHFAMMEGVLLLAVLAQQWRLHLVPGQKIELWPQIMLRPRHAMQMTPNRRNANHAGAPAVECVTQC